MNATETRSPAVVDSELAQAHGAYRLAQRKAANAMDNVHEAVGDRGKRVRGRRVHTLTDAQALAKAQEADPGAYVSYLSRTLGQLLTSVQEAAQAEQEAAQAIAALDAEYTGWSRFFLVPGGHIHSSMHCSTCYPTTEFGWLPELSGKSEAEAVAEQGALLCTVCYPSAPVEWTNHYDLLAAAKAAKSCPGSGKYYSPDLPHRTGYYTGNWGTCAECGERVTLTSTGKLRKHDRKG